jgi:hypothetical protein
VTWAWVGEIGQTVGTTAVVVGAAAWVLRKLIDSFFSTRLTEHRLHLEAQNAAAAERLRADLERIAVEHRVRFEMLHARRMEVLGRLFERIADIERTTRTKTFGMMTKAELEDFSNTIMDFYSDFDRHRYLLPDDVCTLVDRFHLALGIAAFGEAAKEDPNVEGNQLEELMEKAGVHVGTFLKIRQAIEAKFRQLLDSEHEASAEQE